MDELFNSHFFKEERVLTKLYTDEYTRPVEESGCGDYGPFVERPAAKDSIGFPRATNPRERHVKWQSLLSIPVKRHIVESYSALEIIGIDKNSVMRGYAETLHFRLQEVRQPNQHHIL
ncbi:hypothetical protein ACLOAV_009810 [Pseudogymnoascus australis]